MTQPANDSGLQINLPHGWEPRPYQMTTYRKFMYSLKREFRGPGVTTRYDDVWHRRAGKDLFWWNMLIIAANRFPGVYWHCLPTYAQARKVIWNGKTNEGRPYLDYWPPELIEKKHDSDMTIWTTTGSTVCLIGGDNYDSNVGTNPRGIVFSEWSLTEPNAWTYFRPVLAANGGFAAFIYTPRGHNHAYSFHKRAEKIAARDSRWHSIVLTVDDTHAVSQEAIQHDRDEGMPEAIIQQDYYCSFNAPLAGSYFGEYVAKAENEKRITKVPWDPSRLVVTAWDMGFGDSTAIWFVQLAPGGAIHVIDFYRSANVGLDHYVKILQEKPYAYLEDLLPWDGAHHEQGTGKTKAAVLRELGRNVRVVDRIGINDGINAVRAIFPRLWFDAEKCDPDDGEDGIGHVGGVQSLREYSKRWDETNKVYLDTPLHNVHSHAADALRTFAVGFEEYRAKKPRVKRRVANMV